MFVLRAIIAFLIRRFAPRSASPHALSIKLVRTASSPCLAARITADDGECDLFSTCISSFSENPTLNPPPKLSSSLPLLEDWRSKVRTELNWKSPGVVIIQRKTIEDFQLVASLLTSAHLGCQDISLPRSVPIVLTLLLDV